MTLDEPVSVFEALCTRLREIGAAANDETLSNLVADVEAIKHGSTLNDDALATNVKTPARLVAAGEVRQEEADAFEVVAEYGRELRRKWRPRLASIPTVLQDVADLHTHVVVDGREVDYPDPRWSFELRVMRTVARELLARRRAISRVGKGRVGPCCNTGPGPLLAKKRRSTGRACRPPHVRDIQTVTLIGFWSD